MQPDPGTADLFGAAAGERSVCSPASAVPEAAKQSVLQPADWISWIQNE